MENSEQDALKCRKCGTALQSAEMLHIPSGFSMDGFYQCPNGCAVYEAEVLRQDGSTIEIKLMQCATDHKAITRARRLGLEWLSAVRLCKVPAINLTSCASLDFWPDMKTMVDIPPPDTTEFFAWMDELNLEAVRRSYPNWLLAEETAHVLNCWIDEFAKGLTPAQALDAKEPERRSRFPKQAK